MLVLAGMCVVVMAASAGIAAKSLWNIIVIIYERSRLEGLGQSGNGLTHA